MGVYGLIEKKKRGGSLSTEEIAYTVREFVAGDIPDYQMSAMLVAIYFKDIDNREITDLTLEMAHSGDMVDLSPIERIRADKRSAGSVGGKTTLVTSPIVAAYGVKVTRMSGWGLGHTGGVVDKLENIPGFKTAVPREEFSRIINENGLAPVGRSGNMVPADKKLCALRDVTATVDSIPLIASSIMSKKLTAGSDCIVLNVRTGSSAFMKSLEESISLARETASIGTLAGRRCCALIIDVDIPLDHAVGNSLEMEEAIEALKGRGPGDLTYASLKLAVNILHMAGKGDMEQCRKLVKDAMEGKGTLQCLKSMVESQGGDGRYVEYPDLLTKAPLSREVKAPEAGYITHMDTEGVGVAPVILGAGRNKREDIIDYSTGILLRKKHGDRVEAGETIAVLYASHKDLFGPVVEKFLTFCILGKQEPESESLIFARASDADVEKGTIEEKIP